MNRSTRMKFSFFCSGAVLLGACLVGCQEPAQPSGPTLTRVTITSPERTDELWESVGDVLRRHFFELDRQDRQAGVMTTLPDTTASAIELWRPQPTDGYYWLESNIHATQRQATVKLTPSTQPGDYDLDVQVDRYRYSLPERQITNSAAAM